MTPRTSRQFSNRKGPPVPALAEPCGCAVPRIMCETTGRGQVRQLCLKCGGANIVERRFPTVTKARAAEKMFPPDGRR